jgi:anti-sigma regulatory factor (Ser/Thr protein kinase)
MTPTASWPPATPTRWSMMLPKDVPAVRTARTAVEAWLEGMPQRLRDDARSVVTELVGNAVLHGQPPIVLKIERTSEGLRIDVADAGVQRPAYARAGRTQRLASARGLGRLHRAGQDLTLPPRPRLRPLAQLQWPPMMVPDALSDWSATIAQTREWAITYVARIARSRRPATSMVHDMRSLQKLAHRSP